MIPLFCFPCSAPVPPSHTSSRNAHQVGFCSDNAISQLKLRRNRLIAGFWIDVPTATTTLPTDGTAIWKQFSSGRINFNSSSGRGGKEEEGRRRREGGGASFLQPHQPWHNHHSFHSQLNFLFLFLPFLAFVVPTTTRVSGGAVPPRVPPLPHLTIAAAIALLHKVHCLLHQSSMHRILLRRFHSERVRVSEEVHEALVRNQAVVALESTIISHGRCQRSCRLNVKNWSHECPHAIQECHFRRMWKRLWRWKKPSEIMKPHQLPLLLSMAL